ncbi:hypothetical protein EHP00_437 [Ecytonucleospora hepatopenaei]|uniref:Uncharacterized protein n=1 Tax=Ecytonucleospora hepatopenaei TaxID=646526 RepID=A0A1W0E900_9MICR|nr:hypothetical protein EHP00_437 [Ecytonucleospora hepatopenaei]
MYIQDFYSNILEEATQSFIFGTINASVKALINKNENDNFIFNQVKALKEGIQFTQYNMLYTSITYIMGFYEINNKIKDAFSIFITSWLIGKRNGVGYAFKNGLLALIYNFIQKYTNLL